MTDQDSPLISVVVLNWNGRPVLDNCLKSLNDQTYRPLEIIVVDNASTDGSAGDVRHKFPEVKLIVNETNLGFGAGNNIGIQASQGIYIMILNNDTRVDPRCVEELKQSIEKDKNYGACASKILLEKSPDIIDGVGIVVCPDGLSFGRGRLEKSDRFRGWVRGGRLLRKPAHLRRFLHPAAQGGDPAQREASRECLRRFSPRDRSRLLTSVHRR